MFRKGTDDVGPVTWSRQYQKGLGGIVCLTHLYPSAVDAVDERQPGRLKIRDQLVAGSRS
jgi:hypothetical protein